jgi:DNA-binding response OmpR family regulator
MTESTRVLVVDDEPDIADLYTTWLETSYEVVTAYDGRQALESIDDRVDVVFLDRQMPEYSGDEVLERIRERDIECRVVMVTAVDPDFDIVSMGFDDYLTKPVMREDLAGTVESMRERETYDETVQEYFTLAAKKATLEAEKQPTELRNSERYQQMASRVEELQSKADDALASFDDVDSLFTDFSGN